MERICLVALIGLPAVGKTTFSNTVMKMETLTFNILHLCYDNYITIDEEITQKYKEQREIVIQNLETIIQTFKTSKTLPPNSPELQTYYKYLNHPNLLIICDDNHYYRSMRYRLYQLARQYHLSYGQIYFECNQELALKHNNFRSSTCKIPEEVFLQMSKRLEPPNPSCHSWEENTLVLTQTSLNDSFFLEIVPFILKSFEIPVKPLEPIPEKTTTLQSIVHELDLLLRKRIKHLLSSNVATNKKVLANELNEKRKGILKEFQLNINTQFNNVHENQVGDLNKYVQMLQ